MMTQKSAASPLRLDRYDHVKVACENPQAFETSLKTLGFIPINAAPEFFKNPRSVWGSGEAVFCVYPSDHPLAKKHFDLHGDTVFDLSFVLEDMNMSGTHQVIEGAGEMKHTLTSKPTFEKVPAARGVQRFDHNTINVDMGKLDQTVCEYLSQFVLERGQFFNIHTSLTGLKSWVTRAPSLGVQIPFNEATDEKSQVQEYINIHRGPGVQHIALLTPDIVFTMDAVYRDAAKNFEFLDIPDTYYELAKNRVKIKEPLSELERLRILVDQDKDGGYLLQIFTKNIFGGFFFELIQREGNIGFGEGNFQALFESIELDQKRRGVL